VDTQTIDQAYQQLQVEFKDVAKTVQDLAEKMQAAEKNGDTNAKEWLLDLKQIAMDVRDEQTQANFLLQAIHAFLTEAAQLPPAQPAPTAPVANFQQPAPALQAIHALTDEAPQAQPAPMATPVAGPQPEAASPTGGMFGGGGGGRLSGFLGGGFGRAMELGAGVGLGDSLINSIFN
jgi:hypothetical protein